MSGKYYFCDICNYKTTSYEYFINHVQSDYHNDNLYKSKFPKISSLSDSESECESSDDIEIEDLSDTEYNKYEGKVYVRPELLKEELFDFDSYDDFVRKKIKQHEKEILTDEPFEQCYDFPPDEPPEGTTNNLINMQIVIQNFRE